MRNLPITHITLIIKLLRKNDFQSDKVAENLNCKAGSTATSSTGIGVIKSKTSGV